MPRPVTTVSLSSAASTLPIEIFLPIGALAWIGPGLLVIFSAGASATATVDMSGDGVNWCPHSTLANLTGSTAGGLSFPVQFVRLRLSAYTSGTVILSVIQIPGV